MPERDPSITPTCTHCGSDSMIPDAFLHVKDMGQATVQVGLNRDPDALFMKRPERSGTRVQVCGDCGHVELYATDARALWAAHVDRLSREFGS